jgi:hypothetical protein
MKVRDHETGRRHVVGPGVLTGRAGWSGFAYHLVAIAVDRPLVDASADQVNHHGFRLPGVVVANATYGFRRGHLDLALEIAGQAVTYEPIRHSGLSLPLHETREAVVEILAAMETAK